VRGGVSLGAIPDRETGNSRLPTSAQSGIHAHLARLLDRHVSSPFRKPYADYNRVAFEVSIERWRRLAPHAPLILDSCCGVGESSRRLAKAFPTHYVIGVDQSAIRLGRGERAVWQAGSCASMDNLHLVRADVVDFWRLLADAGVRPAHHYLLYPNPWPKIGHLGRRWHGHPVFPTVTALGGRLECRGNWPIYMDEWCFAVRRLTGRQAFSEAYSPLEAITPFERKYLASGHPLFRAWVDLG
jgi:tRNA (guanine-N7-)-methyltransferase